MLDFLVESPLVALSLGDSGDSGDSAGGLSGPSAVSASGAAGRSCRAGTADSLDTRGLRGGLCDGASASGNAWGELCARDACEAWDKRLVRPAMVLSSTSSGSGGVTSSLG